MDHDQQVLQLRDFDQQVASQPDNASSFATKSFLETLNDLLEYGLEKNDDGTDAYKEELKIIKEGTRAFTTVLPIIYKTVCQNEAESRLWELVQSLLTLVKTQLFQHGNAGVQINAIKCLQVLVLALSKSSSSPQKDISLNILGTDHSLLNVAELEKEGHALFEKIIEKLKSDNESVLTATISCLTLIGKKRPQFLKQIITTFTTWRKSRSKDDSPVMLRNVDKAFKLAFVSLIRTESLAPHRSELIQAFGSIGGNVVMFQSRQSRQAAAEESKRSAAKRAAAQQQEAEQQRREKRAKTEYVPIIPSASSQNILANYDITQIPASAIATLCMTVLQTVPLEVMQQRLSMLPPEGVTLAVKRRGFVRSTTPPYPPPPEQPQYNTDPRFTREEALLKEKAKAAASASGMKKEETIDNNTPNKIKLEKKSSLIDSDEDEEMIPSVPVVPYQEEPVQEEEQKPKVQVLASVQERASQALKMQPYELPAASAATQSELSDFEKKELLKMSIQRIFQAERAFQSNVVISETRKAITDGSSSGDAASTTAVTSANGGSAVVTNANPTKNVWLLLVAKLITKGTNMNYKPTNNTTAEAAEAAEAEEAEEDVDGDVEMQDNKLVIVDAVAETSEDDLKELLLDFITENLSTRTDLALEWLHEEYLLDKHNSRLDTSYTPKYFSWLHKLLKKGIPTLDAKDRILTKLLLEAPDINAETIEMVKDNLYNVPERFVSCVSTLRKLITNRPTVRFLALQVLLDLATHENDKMRRTAIVAVKKWNANQQDIYMRVEAFSVEALNVLTTEKDVDMSFEQVEKEAAVAENRTAIAENQVEQQEETKASEEKEEQKDEETEKEDPNAWTEKDVVRHAELYFVLCTKRPSLLKELFSVYIKASELVRKYIGLSMMNMIKSIGMKSLDLNKLVREFPPGGETLCIQILSILCESKPPTREIISIVQTISALAKTRSINVTNLAPILAGHSLNHSTATATTASAAAK